MPEIIRSLIITHPLTLQVGSGDILLTKHFDRLEVDGSAGDVTIILSDNFSPFKGRGSMEIIRIDDLTNVNNIVKIVAETPSNLDETDEEIILDIELCVNIYFSSTNNKYRSVTGFSEKRIQKIKDLSSSVLVQDYDRLNYLATNTTAQSYDTVDVLQGGTGWVIDRTTTLNILSATHNTDAEVVFEVENNSLRAGESFKVAGFTPSAYNTTFPVLWKVKSSIGNNVTVDLSSDPGGNATVIGTALNNNRITNPRVYKVAWIAQEGIDDPSGSGVDGNFAIFVDKTGTVKMESFNDVSLMPSYSTSGENINTSNQLGVATRAAGVFIAPPAPAPQMHLNVSIRVSQILRSLGTLNDDVSPVGIEAMGANLNVRMTAGQGLIGMIGYTGPTQGLSPDLTVLTADIDNAVVVLTDRLNSIISALLTVNVTQYEDPDNPGSFITLQNDTKAKINDYRAFPDVGFFSETLGEGEENSIALAFLANGDSNFPSIVAFGLSTSRLAVLRNAISLVDDSEAQFVNLPRLVIT